jgi:hypothetical protein
MIFKSSRKYKNCIGGQSLNYEISALFIIQALTPDTIKDEEPLETTANDGSYTDKIANTGSGSVLYKVCEFGSSTCSNEVTVSW